MAVLLFKLRGVSEEEADDIRQILTDNEIEYYETTAGNWNISMPGIWLPNDEQLETAQKLVFDYQETRYQDAREEFEEQRRLGQQRTFLDLIRISPLRYFSYLAIIGLIFYLSLVPFLSLTE